MNSNIYTVFEKLIQSINLLGNSPCSILNIPTGAYFEHNPLLKRFDEIIQKNLLVNDFRQLNNQKVTDDFESVSIELKECLNLENRLEAFLLIYNKLFNVYTNEVLVSFKPVLNDLAKNFSIDKYTISSIETFFKNQNLNDIHDSFYIAGPNFNPLSTANGSNVSYLGSENKLIYIKLISNFNILLVKNITFYKSNIQLTDDFENTSINIVDELNFSELVKWKISYDELIQEISKPISSNFIEIKQKEAFPYIKLDPRNGSITIEGISTPISPLSYLEPILDWIDLYCSANKYLEINLTLHYYNTYTTKFLMRLIDKCNFLNTLGFSITINWNYSETDEELKECGELYKDLFINKPEFQLKSIK